jgi:hypothetical protein
MLKKIKCKHIFQQSKGLTLIGLLIVIFILLITVFRFVVFYKSTLNFDAIKSIFHKSDKLQNEYENVTKKIDKFLQLPKDRLTLDKCNELIEQMVIVANGIDDRIQLLTPEITVIQNKIKQLNDELTNISIDQLKEKVTIAIKQEEEVKNDILKPLQFWQLAQRNTSEYLKKLQECRRVLTTLWQLEQTTQKK